MSDELLDDFITRGLSDIDATKDQLLSAVQAGADQADIRRLERAVWQLFDRASALRALLKANNDLRARLAQLESVLAEAREAELTFTHEQISERDQVIADEAWNAALEAAISEAKRMRFGWLNRAQALHKAGQSSTVPSISEDTAAQIIDVMLALRRGAS